MEYSVSSTEIRRRKFAYASLAISLIIGTFISSTIYQFFIPGVVYLLLAISLLLLGAFSFTFFGKIASLTIYISENELQRKVAQTIEKYPVSKIKKITIKWTSHNSIREMYIWLHDGRSIFVTGLTDFERFRTDLLTKLDKHTVVHEWREPINFDSLLFYPILGVLISNVSILAIKNIVKLNDQQMKWGMWLFGGYLFIFGLYFILATPISKRSGNTTRSQDYIMGILMTITGILILISADVLIY
jgi:hypothetical protein